MSSTSRLLTALFLVAGSSGCGAPTAGDDLCQSPQFRDAFLEGQQGVIIDYTDPSPELISLGDRALPCLTQIAERGGEVFGIKKCLGGPDGCSEWALGAIRMIGTPDARAFLLSHLDAMLYDPERMRHAIKMLGSLQDPSARPRLLELLTHPDPEVRAQSVTSLGAIGDPRDYDVMLRTAIELPDEAFYHSAHGLRILGDERALEALRPRIEKIEDPTIRSAVERTHESWRYAIREEERVITILRTASGRELFQAIQDLRTRPPSEGVREALLDLLEHEDARVRAVSVKALGKFNDASDFDKLLEVTLNLPEVYVVLGAEGLEYLNDARAIEPLERYAENVENQSRRNDLGIIVDRIRRRSAQAQTR